MAKITLEISDEVECTAAPYWIILDPTPIVYSNNKLLALQSMFKGIFFSRIAAEKYLLEHDREFSVNACVWCGSCRDPQYRKQLGYGEF